MIIEKKSKIIAHLVSFLLLFAVVLPNVAFAVEYLPIVQCGNSAGPYTGKCDFQAAIGMINRVINWIISIAGVIFTVSFIYGGFLYITSGENPGNKTKAKEILWNTLLGFVIILVAWLIVYTILINLVPSDSSVFNFIKK